MLATTRVVDLLQDVGTKGLLRKLIVSLRVAPMNGVSVTTITLVISTRDVIS